MNKNTQQIVIDKFTAGLKVTHGGEVFLRAPNGTNLSLSSKEAFHAIKSVTEEISEEYASKGQVLAITNQLHHEASKLPPSAMDIRLSSSTKEILLHLGESNVSKITKKKRTRCKNDKSFIAPEGYLPLPDLVKSNKDILYSLNDFMNLDEEQFACFMSWILAVFMPEGTIPILAISGSKESGKTTIARIAKALIDPAEEDVHKLSTPQALKDLSQRNKILVFDDITHIPDSMVAPLCEAASGKKNLSRVDFVKTHTPHSARTAIILCSENNVLGNKHLRRIAIPIEAQRITGDKWKSMHSIGDAFQNLSGMLLNAALKIVKSALNNYESPEDHAPLTHTFAWTRAWETTLFPKGEVEAYLRENIAHLGSLPATAEVFEKTLTSFINKEGYWSGTASSLLKKLIKLAGKKAKSEYWPKDAANFSSRLKRIEHSLFEMGISVSRSRTKNKRILTLKRLDT